MCSCLPGTQTIMTSNKIPVTFEFFKRYTYHEEWVEIMLKAKANGHKEKYEALMKSNESKESALRSYYEAFYLKPKIREKYHIRLKPVPKKIKDKLLVIPVQDTEAICETYTSGVNHELVDIIQDVINGFDKNSKITDEELKNAKYVRDGNDHEVEDDSEPSNSPDNSYTSKQINLKVNSPMKMQENKEPVAFSSKTINSPAINLNSKQTNVKISSIEKKETVKATTSNDKPTGLMESNNNKQANFSTASKEESPEQTAARKKPNFNYQALIPYIHCCPLTLKEFRKYSNITQLVTEFCANKHMASNQQRMIVQRSYILFYLAPEHRKITPINKIQLLANSPQHIKNKFFDMPTNLYEKNEDLNRTQDKIENTSGECEQPTGKNKKTKEQKILPETNTEPVVINNESDTNNNEAPQPTISTTAINDVNQQATIPETINNSNEQVNNVNQQEMIPLLTQQSADPIVNIPVSLEEFKKYTHYEEIIETLFKIKAQDNKELYYKYINSQEIFDRTLCNYYRTFYLSPIIREILPIRFKPLPNFLKNHLLQIPEGALNAGTARAFRVEEFISLDFNLPVVSVEAGNAATQQKDAINSPYLSSTSPTNSTAVTIKTEKDTDSSDADNKTKSPATTGTAKRATTEDTKSPSPKRQKTQQQTQDYSENTDRTKKSYKDLLPYAHCCPVTFTQFRKYTNVTELFSGYCQRRYKSVKKLPYMLKRAYVLYYLAPENRNFKPFNKLKTLNECPIDLRNKIFEIPRNLYLKTENTNIEQTEEHIVTQMENKTANNQNSTQQLDATNGAKPNSSKAFIEILENRLLPPTTLPFSAYFCTEGQCANTNCVFHHTTYADFMQLTNILDILPEPHDISVIQNIFKKFIYKIVKEQNCDEKYVVNCALLCKLLKHQEMCEKCENDLQPLLKQNTSMTSTECERESFSNGGNTTVIERFDVNKERMQTSTESLTIAVEPMKSQTLNKSSISNEENISAEISQSQQATATEQQKESEDLWKFLNNDRIFQLFCTKLMAKLKQTLDNNVDFNSNTYEIFLQCNEIPLGLLLNDFCAQNEDIKQRILKERELCEALQRYYYYKYLTNTSFALKYPLQIKQQTVQENIIKTEDKVMNMSEEIQKDKINTQLIDSNEINLNGKTITLTTTEISEENLNNAAKSQEKGASNSNNNNPIEKAKRIFFRHVEKTNTLSYILCTSFSFKQLILRSILSMTFEEFLQLTSIYEGKELYNDKHLAECMYRYVFRTPMVWPTNLFITLQNLLDFLHAKYIHFDDYSTMLTHISPKLLHWSVLLSCTNILECVQIDYEKRTGNFLDTYDIAALKHECIEYYNRCWKHEKWLGDVPVVNEEFYKNYLKSNDQGDVSMLDESALQEIRKEPNEDANDIASSSKDIGDTSTVQQEVSKPAAVSNLNTSGAAEKVPDFVSEMNVETTEDENNSPNNRSINEFNCVILPNTQQQIEMLPAEVPVSNDPLNYSNNSVLSSNSDHYEVESLGELIVLPHIKTEPLDNLLFYEDENSIMQCTPCADEIVDLDDSRSQASQNLPPSQIEFENTMPEFVLSDDNIMNLAQCLPSSIESNDATACTQQFMQEQPNTPTPIIQLPDVSLRSSGENEIHKLVLENQQQKQKFTTKEPQQTNTEQFELIQNLCEASLSSVQSFITYPEAQCFPSTFEDTQTYSENLSANPATTPLQQDVIGTITSENVNVATTETSSANSSTAKQLSNINTAALPLRRGIAKTYARVKIPKNVAKVRPLKNSDFVPQIQHNTRPLLTTTVFPTSSSNKELQPTTATHILEQSPTITLTPPENNSVTNEQTVQDSSLQIKLQPLGTQIYISQELNRNCSVFNNSSLLRIVDHNYHQQSLTHSEETVENSQTAGKSSNTDQEPAERVTHRSSMSANKNIQPTSTQNPLKITTTTTNVTNCQASTRKVTRRTSIYKDSNDKVNNLPLIPPHTNNLVATIAPTIHRHQPYNMVRKLSIYRQLINFHYFKELTPQHISKYLLPSLEFGKSYTEATVVCEHLKTRISNRSISAIFAFWPQNIQRDFLLVLSDLKEFHYVAFECASVQKHQDLRTRILFWLLNTAPLFALCQFIYEANNAEFAHCESIKNSNNPSYKRRPFKCVTNALSKNVLEKLKNMKRDSEMQ